MSTPEPASPPIEPAVRRWRAIRLISALLTVVSVIALGLMALASPKTVTTHTTEIKKTEAAAKRAPASAPATTPAAVPLATAPALVDTTAPVSTLLPVTEASVATVAPDPAATPAPLTPPASAVGASTSATTTALPLCPLPLAAPAQPGGLASLIGLSPLFGPFSAEAFASAAAFQPVLELFGPFLIAFANAYATAEPSLAPLISQLEALENQGFTLITPLYGPYRTQFLTAETNLASALAPFAQTLATNPAASCLIDVEAVLTSAK
jgi:hypothetical protein